MDNSLKKRAYIPPYWVSIAIAICTLVLAYILALCEMEPGKPFVWPARIESRFLRFAAIYVLIQSAFHWSIHKKYIMIHFLWIPVFVIPWERVSHAEYIYKWSTGGKFGRMEGQGIFVTLKGCPYFSPEVDALNMFMMKHPFHTLFIRFTPRNQQRYVAIFKKYYPDLDFQIGYEENLKKGKPYHAEDVWK